MPMKVMFSFSLAQHLGSIAQLCSRPEKWATRNSSENMYVQNLIIDVQESICMTKAKVQAAKEQPVWMTQSTVQGASVDVVNAPVGKPILHEECIARCTVLFHSTPTKGYAFVYCTGGHSVGKCTCTLPSRIASLLPWAVYSETSILKCTLLHPCLFA